MISGILFGWFLTVMALGNAVATPPVREYPNSEVDILALNDCIEDAISKGESWSSSPGTLISTLFGVNAECVQLGGGGVAAEESLADSTVTVVFRHVVSDGPSPNRWLEARLRLSSDGTWRVHAVDLYENVQARISEQRVEDARRLGYSVSGFDFGSANSLDLLDFLGARRGYWVASLFPKGWVKEKDLSVLMERIDSRAPCANVMSMASSYIDTATSTVGNEAAYLIEGFRDGRYPPRLNSTRPVCDIDEIKLWWVEREGT